MNMMSYVLVHVRSTCTLAAAGKLQMLLNQVLSPNHE